MDVWKRREEIEWLKEEEKHEEEGRGKEVGNCEPKIGGTIGWGERRNERKINKYYFMFRKVGSSVQTFGLQTCMLPAACNTVTRVLQAEHPTPTVLPRMLTTC
jgi:hypothetical protein